MRICVICEGSYPYVAGGVSTWLHNMIQAMPQHEFVIWSIGAEEKQKGKYAYEMPENVVRIKETFLDSVTNVRLKTSKRSRRLNESQKKAVYELLRCGNPDWDTLFQILGSDPVKNVEFLMNRDFLNILEEICGEDFPHVGFTDYFWTIRSMFLPMLYLLGNGKNAHGQAVFADGTRHLYP